MSIEKLNIEHKQDSPAKKKLIASGDISSKETLTADEINELTSKTNELVDAYNFGAPITAFNFKTNVPTYADLPLVGNEVNDGYGVIEDGLVYVWNGTAFPPEGDGMDLGLKPTGAVAEGVQEAVSGEEVYSYIKINEGEQLIPDDSKLNTETELIKDTGGKGISAGWFELRYPEDANNSITKTESGTFIVELNNSGGAAPAFWVVNKISNDLRGKDIELKFTARKLNSAAVVVTVIKGNVEYTDQEVITLSDQFTDYEFVINIGKDGLTPHVDNRIAFYTGTNIVFEITNLYIGLAGTGELSKRVSLIDKRIGNYPGEDVIPDTSRLNEDTDLIGKTAGIFEIRYSNLPSNYVTKQSDYFSVFLSTDGLLTNQHNPAFWAINKISNDLRGKKLLLSFDVKGVSPDTFSIDADGSGYSVDFSTEWETKTIEITFGNTYGDMRLMFYYNTLTSGRPGSVMFDIRNLKLINQSVTIANNVERLNSEVGSLKNASKINTPIWSNFPYKSLSPNIPIVVGMFGDSWTDHVPGAIFYARDLSRLLRDEYGNGGGGWYDFSLGNTSQKMGSIDPLDANDTRSGDITYKDQTSDAKGINFAHAEFYEGSTISLQVLTPHTHFSIHYYASVGGGIFRYRVDSGDWNNVNTDSVVGYSHINVPVTDGTHVIDFECISGTCVILGVDMQRDSGVRVHKFGNRGLRAYNINDIDTDNWAKSIESFGLDCMTILLGTNDRTVGRLPADFKNDMRKIVQVARTYNNFMDIALIAPSNNRNSANYPMEDYSLKVKEITNELNLPFIDLIPLFGTTEAIIEKGTFHDSVHPTEKGGQMIANYLFKQLFQ